MTGTPTSRVSRIGRANACLISAALMMVGLFLVAPRLGGLFREPWDKLVHFVFYGTVATLLGYGGGPRRLGYAFLLTCLAGAADETYQIFLPGRSAGLDDFAVDCLAALFAVLWVAWYFRRQALQVASEC